MKLYGIKNCDTVKKARKWLDAHAIEYTFVDLKSTELEHATVSHWITNGEGAPLINTRGTTFRGLSDAEKNRVKSAESDIALIIANPMLIKRPVLVDRDRIEIGFNEARYSALFS